MLLLLLSTLKPTMVLEVRVIPYAAPINQG